MARRIRIVSDGTPFGTRVLLPDGYALPGVRRIEWSIAASQDPEFAEVRLTLIGVDVDLVGEASAIPTDTPSTTGEQE